ncbi:PREDICTED: zinc finger protein 33A isoform X2 [Drosophila arizonae]|uniref:Zinc finger protein 33A isoform X2 n=1 Tax=Drosophila arizonae TaxID=7263 RepID=A0ABM1PVT0_DROAR|nr:PREDICTED: zinc finger protein 33A isoform X2 [Drosophila arizonae]
MVRAESILRCYLCNCTFEDNKVYEHMFDQRYDADGIELKSLANILAIVLGYELQKEQLHSTFVCSTCKVSLLNFEALENQVTAARLEIQEKHMLTLELNGRLIMKEEEEEEVEEEEEEEEEEEDENELLSEDNSLLESDFVEEHTITNVEHLNILERCPDDIELINEMDTDTDTNTNTEINNIDYDECDSDEEEEPEDNFKVKQGAGKQSKAQAKNRCGYCGKTFGRRQWLEDHERVHTGERPYKCDQCHATFAQRANLRSHLLATHENKTSFKCNQCERSFKRRRLLANHIKSKHTQVRDVKCEFCEATFASPINMMKHMLCHTGKKNYSCEICGKQFSRPENRNVHHFVHSIRKPYACVVCDEDFMRKQQLQKHIAITQHPNPKIVRRQPMFSAANSDKLLQRPLSEANK